MDFSIRGDDLVPAIIGSDFTQTVVVTGVAPTLVSGLDVFAPDGGADTQQFYAGATSPPLTTVLEGAGDLDLSSGWTFRVNVEDRASGLIILDQPATMAADSDGRPVFSYAWTSGPMVAGSYWYWFTATQDSDGRVLILPRRQLEVRDPV